MKGFFKFLCIVILIVIIVLLCKNYVKENEETVETSTENVVVENEVSKEENSATKVKNEIIENDVVELVPRNNVYELNTDVGTTNKKQEAIDKVKEVWGADDTVTYRCDSVTADGEYIIAVVSKQTMTVKNYFRVNLEKDTVDVDY